jgi:8-hydroxy-5-deazaflavin:NADPH oxidoreductase
MKITIIGTGFIGSTLGRALSGAGHAVTYGSRRADDDVATGTTANVLPIDGALLAAEVVILAIPGGAVSDLTREHGSVMAGSWS